MHKHATYQEFLNSDIHENMENLFIFASVRNPLDEAVSRYFKYKNDHRGIYSDPGSITNRKVDYADVEKYHFIKESAAGFNEFFRKYYRRPYGTILDYFSDKLSYLMYFERLQEDFFRVLGQLNMNPTNTLSIKNKTVGRGADWKSYYSTETIGRAKKVMGPFMTKYGYTFPPEWGNYEAGTLDILGYRSVNQIRRLYTDYIRYNNSQSGKVVRKLRSILIK